jgi:hypothetical protein
VLIGGTRRIRIAISERRAAMSVSFRPGASFEFDIVPRRLMSQLYLRQPSRNAGLLKSVLEVSDRLFHAKYCVSLELRTTCVLVFIVRVMCE